MRFTDAELAAEYHRMIFWMTVQSGKAKTSLQVATLYRFATTPNYDEATA